MTYLLLLFLASKINFKEDSNINSKLNDNIYQGSINFCESFSITQAFSNSNQYITPSPSPTYNTKNVPSIGVICGTCAACFATILIISSIVCFRKEKENKEIPLQNSAIQELLDNKYEEIA